MNSKFQKNKNINPNIYREMAVSSGCELPCAIDEQNVNIRKDGTVGTITTDGSSPKHNNRVLEENLRIRKLTPKECFRLMGFEDSDFEKAEKVNSNTQLYKQAGNSIVVPFVEYIIKALFDCGALEKEREDEEMELKINEFQTPEKILFNYEELKSMIQEKVQMYETMVYTDDQIKDAKADRAKLNKFVQALEAKRKEVKKQCLAPYEEFEKKMKEIIAIVNEPIQMIDSQVKGYEEQKKAEKLEQIQEYWNRVTSPEHPLTLQRVMNPKWLNATTSMKSIQEEINGILAKYAEDIATLQELPEIGFEAIEVYKTTLDLNTAVSEGKRLSEMAKRKAEQEILAAEAEAKKQEEQVEGQIGFTDTEGFEKLCPDRVKDLPTEPLKQWVGFKALLSVDDAMALKDFFESRNIEFAPI